MICLRSIAAPVFLGRDNVLRFVLEADGAVLADLSGITRVVVDMDGGTTVIDSDLVAGAIWWTDQLTYRGALVDVLSLRLGGQAIPAATYSGVAIIVYDASYPSGLLVENAITLTVQS